MTPLVPDTLNTIESGSLLGVKYKEVPSYAVGFEEIVLLETFKQSAKKWDRQS